jgi:H+/Cl- antiporter ClcA
MRGFGVTHLTFVEPRRATSQQPNEKETVMGLGVGIFLAAIGAVLAFAVTDNVSGVNIHTVGWILLIVGILGIILSMIFWSSWAGPGYWSGGRRRTTTIDEGPAGPGAGY